MTTQGVAPAIEPIVDAFEDLGVLYSVVGSIASSSHGMPRSTIDIDLVANLRMPHVAPLVAALTDTYYLDEDAARDAVRRRAMFNAIHLETMLKVNVYVLTDRACDQESFRRRARATLADDPSGRTFFFDTPEDTVVHKLEWYRKGEVSRRQWDDIRGVLRVQADALDIGYMEQWAAAIGVDDLLARALAESTGSSND